MRGRPVPWKSLVGVLVPLGILLWLTYIHLFVLFLILVVLILLGISIGGLWIIPKWQVAAIKKHREAVILDSTGSPFKVLEELTPDERFELENKARKTLAQIIGGVVVLSGLFFTAENLRITQQNTEKNQKLIEKGQVTERFTQAIAQLGNDKLEVRLGGVYALEKIAQDYPDDYHWTIMEIFTTLVREKTVNDHASDSRIMTNIQAILTVIGRRMRTYGQGEFQELNLSNSDLRGMSLYKANLRKANLTKADLRGAIFSEAELTESNLSDAKLEAISFSKANLYRANLSRASLLKAEFSGATISGADLTDAILSGVKLSGLDISGADMRGAILIGTILIETNLSRTNLSRANLTAADLTGANLSRAILIDTKLGNSNLIGADLSGADLTDADVSGANFTGADLARADLAACKNLTWEQIDRATIDKNTKLPPVFEPRKLEKLTRQVIEQLEKLRQQLMQQEEDRRKTKQP